MKQFITLGLFVLLSLSSARALLPCENGEGVCDGNQAVAIDCQDTKNAIVIRDTCVSDKWTKSCEAQGVYSIWGLMEVGTDDNITKTTPAVHKCKLAKGNYEVLIEPSPFNQKVTSHCGASPTTTVTLRDAKQTLFTRRLLRNCDTGPRTAKINFDAAESKIWELLEFDPAFSADQ